MKPNEIRRTRRLAALAQRHKPDGLDNYFIEIAQQFRPYIQALAFSMLQDWNAAEDIASEALCKGYIHLHGFIPEEREDLKAKAWLGEITRNLCIDYQNKGKEESIERLMEVGYQIVAHPYQSPENAAFYADAVTLISRSLASLTPREREVVWSYIALNMRAADVASALGISQSYVYVITARAVRKLRHPQLARPLIIRDESGRSFGLILDRGSHS